MSGGIGGDGERESGRRECRGLRDMVDVFFF